ncbi:MAG: glycosyltransferase family 4 protein [Candidatus Buchananbacteria bacterium]
MKILFVSDDFPPVTHTGPSIVTYNLAQGLIKLGHSIFVIASVQDKQRAGMEIYDGIEVHRIYACYPDRWNSYVSLFNPQVVFKFKKIIKKIKPDICHFHNVHGHISYHTFSLGRRYSRAVFLTAHDTMLFNYGKLNLKNGTCRYKVSFVDNLRNAKKRYNPLRNILIKHYLKYIDKIFCITNAQKELLALNGITNTATIHNAIASDYWQNNNSEIEAFKEKFKLAGKKVVMFGGRLSEAKGGGAIIEAMTRVVKEVDNAVLVVVGEMTGYAKDLINKINNTRLADKVLFTGWLSRQEIGLAFFSADVCVTPSIYFDPFNLFNIEAMSAGKPVVGTCFGGTPEIVVDGVTGYIVNPLKTEEFADRIVDLLKQPDLAEKFGRAGRQRVLKDFSLNEQMTETLGWYNKFIDK